MDFCKKIDYFPIKVHYFFFNAALAGILPYLTVYAKQLGISSMSVGLIFTVVPLMTMIAKPLVGAIADHTKKLKTILHLLLLVISVSSLLVIFIPIKNKDVSSTITCSFIGTAFLYDVEQSSDCMSEIPKNKEFSCILTCKKCNILNNSAMSENPPIQCSNKHEAQGELTLYHDKSNSSYFNVTKLLLNNYNMNVMCLQNLYFDCFATCDPVIHNCYKTEETSDFISIQFWLFFILVIFINVFGPVSGSLGDAACFNLLGENAHLYGNQRLWGTIGWGVSSALSGALNNLATGSSFIHSYYPSFSLVALLLMIDIVAIQNVNMDNLMLSKSIFKDVVKLLKKANILMFLCSVFVMGILTGLLWSFLFWHLDTLHASALLLGGISAVQCLIGELPFIYFSHFILSKIGHFNTLTVSFLAFGVRFVLYSYLENPSWALLMEILQGPSLGLFFSTMPTYANIAAMPGTEATMQGLAGGAFEGLGIAVGSYLGGIGMQKYGGSGTFFRGGILSLTYSIINILFTIILHFKNNAERKRSVPNEMIESPNEGTSFM